MSVTAAAVLTMVVLSAAGLLPVLGLVGFRMLSIPLAPLAGAVIAALAATAYVAVGGSFIAWFVGLSVVVALLVGLCWLRLPGTRPQGRADPDRYPASLASRVLVVVGALAIVAACVWSLRGLATPTVGFDARALWLMRAGWFLQPHHELLTKLKVPNVVLIQSAYPPLVSAVTAVAWKVTGNQTMRLGVVVISLLNACALAAAAFAIIESGRSFVVRLAQGTPDEMASSPTTRRAARKRPARVLPLVVAVVCAPLLVVIAFGITEPFMTNGYADPIWSLAAVGVVAYGLQMSSARANRSAAFLLVLVAGMSKDEGVATAVGLIVLVALRGVVTLERDDRRRQWWHPVGIGIIELALVGAWPALMRVVHARGQSSSYSPAGQWISRANTSFHGMTPYLHVIVLAAPMAVVGGLVLSKVRRRTEAANDWWAWAGLACGFLAVWVALIAGTASIKEWLETTVHRVTEFPALTGWWIVAMWAAVASAAPGAQNARSLNRSQHSIVAPTEATPDGSSAVDEGDQLESLPVAVPGPGTSAS